jgi:Dolichyl-phosphate-mannose-protein mannosyltransferase
MPAEPQKPTLLLFAWTLLAAIIILGTQIPSLIWAFANPTPHHWDNAIYLNQAYHDLYAWRNHGLINALLHDDIYRPPAYRIFTAPLLTMHLPMLAKLRTTSFLFFWATLFVVYRICTTTLPFPAGRAAGMLAVVLICLSPEIGWSIRIYGTEYPLYFATALTLLFLIRSAGPRAPSHWSWIGLGIALAIGLLSKFSFVLLAAPLMATAAIFIFRRKLPGLPPVHFAAAVALAAVLSLPYYSYHFFTVLSYSREMTAFSRTALHQSGTAFAIAWIKLQLSQATGAWGGAILIVLAAAAIVSFCKWNAAVILALSQALPLLAIQLFYARNDNVRHLTPAYLPLITAVAIAAGAAGLLTSGRSWLVLLAVALPALIQTKNSFLPIASYRTDVWDFTPIHDAAAARGITSPRIAYLGNGEYFNEPFFALPWSCLGQTADSQWLWRYEQGPINWKPLISSLNQFDMILTAPGIQLPADPSLLPDPQMLDNVNNAEFARCLLNDARFTGPEKFTIGTQTPTEIWLFFRKPAHDLGRAD